MATEPGDAKRSPTPHPRLGGAWAAARALWSEDRGATRLVVIFALFQLTAVFWDVPGAWSWENDAVAPRELFNCVVTNLSWGRGHNYPIFHSFVLFILAIPFVIPSVFGLETWADPEAIRYAVLHPAAMTPILVVSKLVTVAMGMITLLVLARIARRLFGPGAGVWAAAFAATNLSVAYYFRTTNLDGPYMMWTVLAVDSLLRCVDDGAWRHYLTFGVFAALAVATKDQAYGAFVLLAPFAFVLMPLIDPGALAAGDRHARRLAAAFGVSCLTYGAASGALLNPPGFIARVNKLAGANSQDWRTYPPTWSGRLENMVDAASSQAAFWWPWWVVAIVWLGVVIAMAKPRGDGPLGRQPWRAVPLVAAASAFVSFTLVVGRNEERFLLPQALWLSVYGGVAAVWLGQRAGAAGRAVCAGALVTAVASTTSLHVTQWLDTRWPLVAWLEENATGLTVETYGLTVYQPHFDLGDDAPYRVQRVGPKPPRRRNPLGGADEIQAPYLEIARRRPDVIVVLEAFARRYVAHDREPRSTVSLRARASADATRFFRAAVADQLPGYRLRAVFEPQWPAGLEALGLRPVTIHGSTGERIYVLSRVGGGASARQGCSRSRVL